MSATMLETRQAAQHRLVLTPPPPPSVALAQPSVTDLVKVLDKTAPKSASFLPQHGLPTPPSTSPVARAVDFTHPAFAEPILDIPVGTLLRDEVSRRAVHDMYGTGDDSAFFGCDLSATYQAVEMWRASPMGSRVEIFYAVKCNPSPQVLHLLSLLGTSFDCASMAEINQVLGLPCAPDPKRIIFANPCKSAGFIRAAADRGVDMMTFDNADELYKIKRTHPTAKLVLRILTDDSKSLCRLGLKFGASLETCPALLVLARKLELDVVGVSFHVGSGCKDPMQFADAIWRSRRVFDMAKAVGYTPTLLDIGGGFERETFAEMSQVVKDSLDVYFPEKDGVRVIAEPGRLLVSSAFTLATNIIARRRGVEEPEAGPSTHKAYQDDSEATADVMYYINDGVYGSFNCIMFDHQIVHPHPLTLANEIAHASPSFPPPPNVKLPVDLPVQLGYNDVERASVWGPTCDSIDCVREIVHLPRGLEVGDWVGWSEMGAYTLCAASTFNGFKRSPVLWTTGGTTSPHAIAVRETLDAFASSSTAMR